MSSCISSSSHRLETGTDYNSAQHHQTAFLVPLLLYSSRVREKSHSTALPEVYLLSLKWNWCSLEGKEKQKQSLIFLTYTHCQAAQPDLFEASNVLPSNLPYHLFIKKLLIFFFQSQEYLHWELLYPRKLKQSEHTFILGLRTLLSSSESSFFCSPLSFWVVVYLGSLTFNQESSQRVFGPITESIIIWHRSD